MSIGMLRKFNDQPAESRDIAVRVTVVMSLFVLTVSVFLYSSLLALEQQKYVANLLALGQKQNSLMLNSLVTIANIVSEPDSDMKAERMQGLGADLEELQSVHTALSYGGELGIEKNTPAPLVNLYFGPTDYFERKFRLFVDNLFEIFYAIEDGVGPATIQGMTPNLERIEYFSKRGQEITDIYIRIVEKKIENSKFVQLASFVFFLALAFYSSFFVFAPMVRRIRDSVVERESRSALLETAVAERTAEIRLEQERTAKLNELNVRMAQEENLDELVENIMNTALDLASADGGTIYLPTADSELRFAFMITRSEGLAFGGTSKSGIPYDPLPMFHPESGEPNEDAFATRVAHSGRTQNNHIPNDTDRSSDGARKFEEITKYHSEHILTVAMKNRSGDLVGVLQLVNALDDAGGYVEFQPEIVPYIESLANQAAVVLELRTLVEQQKKLIDSFIQVIATSIDHKSPYTGGHCLRVPAIAKLLAQKACDEDSGPFEDFAMTDKQWREFETACYLHDCGKVTTPEYVVDKATKLEAIYNRIHEIRLRFEVLWRDAKIARLEENPDNPLPEKASSELDGHLETLREEFAFIANCNIGGEFMAPEMLERVKEIGSRVWYRQFDDRLGLSFQKADLLKDIEIEPLPARETLLADKPEHIVPYEKTGKIDWKESYGFVDSPPEHRFNYGEIHNLGITRGTLTAEERFKINEHINQTIVMLETLPFPTDLKRVPEIAGGHHERMDGAGYPRGVKAGDMSVSARIMAVADVFEALTAADRPYKPAKKMSETLSILKRMSETGHLDRELYELFIKSDTWREYGAQYLTPEQMDCTDATSYL